MTDIFHGDWERYTPVTLPEGAPSGAMFARRTSDGADWYDFVNGDPFGPSSVIFTVNWNETQNGWVVGSAVRDPTRLFPAGQGVYEIPSYSGDETALNTKLYDPETGEFSDLVPIEAPQTRHDAEIAQALANIQNRLDALEK